MTTRKPKPPRKPAHLDNARMASRLLRSLAAKIDQGKAVFQVEGTGPARDLAITDLDGKRRPAELTEFRFKVQLIE